MNAPIIYLSAVLEVSIDEIFNIDCGVPQAKAVCFTTATLDNIDNNKCY